MEVFNSLLIDSSLLTYELKINQAAKRYKDCPIKIKQWFHTWSWNMYGNSLSIFIQSKK